MTPFLPMLPLAADIGDFIFLIIVLVGGLVQWLSGLKRKKPEQEGEAFPADPFGGPETPPSRGQDDPTWDELMDALGRNPREVPPEVPETYAPTPVAPPPLPVPTVAVEPARPHLSTAFQSLDQTSPPAGELNDHLKALLAEMEKPKSAMALETSGEHRTAAASPVQSTGEKSTRIGRWLREPGQLRRAVVLQEILQPPLALR